jgi:WD40 repeat protein
MTCHPSCRHYTHHAGEVSCLGVHPEGDVIATGEFGKGPAIHVWDVRALKTLAVLKGMHRRAVGRVAFSVSGRFLATVGEGRGALLVVYDWRRTDGGAVVRIAQCDLFVFDMW